MKYIYTLRFIFTALFICSSYYTFAQMTITLRPDSEIGKDAVIADNGQYNNGENENFYAMAWTNEGNPVIIRSLIEFDLSFIPPTSFIISSYLSLYNNPDCLSNNGEHSSLSGPNTCWLQRITQEWDEHVVIWANQPTVTTLHQVTLPQSISPHQDYEDIDVTQLITDMIQNPETSHGFMLRLAQESYWRCMIFASSDHQNPEWRPKLVITYFPPVVADFSFTVMDKTASFFSQCQGATSFLWNFGDNIHSILENPVHTYQQYGDYEVTLIADNPYFSDTITKMVKICIRPVAAFSYQIEGFEVSLTNLSQNALSYFWDFGDGSFSYLENPIHTYSEEGQYEIHLVVSNECDSDTMSASIYLYMAPIADFSFTIEDRTVHFLNQSQVANSYLWVFGDGDYSALENPVHTYSQLGDYEVTLVAGNAFTTDTTTQLIRICTRPVADFNYQVDGYRAIFTNLSQEASIFQWDFGDGFYSVQDNPIHVYSDEGEYYVRLVADNDCQQDTITKCVGICSPPEAGFDYTCNQLKVYFTNLSSHYDSYFWDFGDGTWSDLSYPVKIYNEPGDYDVSLMAILYCGNDTLINSQTMNIVLPCLITAAFSYDIRGLEVTFTNNSSGATTFLWDFGDGKTSAEINPVHDYEEIGDYEVMLAAGGDHGSDTVKSLINLTAIPEIIGENSFRIYPNPASNKVYLKINNDNIKVVQYTLLTIHGQVVRHDEMSLNHRVNELDIAGLPPGIYLLRIISQGIFLTRKLIVY